MKLHLKGEDLELYSPRIMGALVVHPGEIGSVEDFVRKAKEMQEDGADFIEIGLQVEEGIPEEADELTKLVPIVKAVAQNTSLYVAITRAKLKLYFTVSRKVKSFEKIVDMEPSSIFDVVEVCNE